MWVIAMIEKTCNGRTKHRISSLAISLLGSVYLAFAAVPALASNKVNVTVNPTTGYFESNRQTIRTPSGTTNLPVKDINPIVQRMPNGGLSQSISSGIEITALKKSAPVTSKLRMGAGALKNAGVRCLTSARCNIAMMAGAAGLNKLFDGLDWVMGDGGKITKRDYSAGSGSQAGYILDVDSRAVSSYSFTHDCPAFVPAGESVQCSGSWSYRAGQAVDSSSVFSSNLNRATHYYRIRVYNASDIIGLTYRRHSDVGFDLVPVSDADIAEGVDSNYNPEPSDLPFLSPQIDLSAPDVDIEITNSPRLESPPVTKTIHDADGNPISVQETNIWHDFSPVNNPSKSPGFDEKVTEETNTYDSAGNLTGSTSTVTNNTASNTTTNEAPETPIDCDLMPSLCKWMEWTQEDPDLDEPDLDSIRQVIDLRDYQESVTIGPDVLACPAPYELSIGFIDRSVSISFEPFCQLADFMRPLLLMLAFFSAAYITLRSI